MGGDFMLRGEVSYRGAYNHRVIGDTTNDRVPRYTLLNAYAWYNPISALSLQTAVCPKRPRLWQMLSPWICGAWRSARLRGGLCPAAPPAARA
ncbi:hypothetical protein WSK_2840 [Novosphingobium sp. Rr 2-17]|nr:hypothetical protein WSK_2840 [Novosphingobium sp. Rr 2-17]